MTGAPPSLVFLTPSGNGTPTSTLLKGTGSANYTTTSTSFTAVDATNLKYVVTIPLGWKLLINAAGVVGNNTGTPTAGAKVGIADGSTIHTQVEATGVAAGATNPFALTWIITGDGNSHTIELQFATGNAADACVISNVGSGLVPNMTFFLTPSN